MGKAAPRGSSTIRQTTQRQYLQTLFDAGLKLIPLEPHGKHTQEKDWNKRGESDIEAYLKRAASVWHQNATALQDAIDQPIADWFSSGFNHGVLNDPSQTLILDFDDPLAMVTLEAGLKHVGSDLTVKDLADLTPFRWISPRGTKLLFRRPAHHPGTTQRIVRRVRTPDGRTAVQTIIEFRGSGQDVLPYSHRGDHDFVLKWAHPDGHLPAGSALPPCPAPLTDLLKRLTHHDPALVALMQQAAGTDPSLTGMDSIGDHDYPARLAGRAAERTAINANLSIEKILLAHGYTKRGQRWNAPDSHHAAGIAPSKTERGIWVNYHESDPLSGRFDAWRAFIELEHGGNLVAACESAREFTRLRPVPKGSPAAIQGGTGDKKGSGGIEVPPDPAKGAGSPTEETVKPPKARLSVVTSPQPHGPAQPTTHGRTLASLSADPVSEVVLIAGVALAQTLIYLGGSWSAGKTAFACSMACSVASGLGNMLGQRCVTGTVVYFSIEDPATVQRRARAWQQYHAPQWPGLNLLFYSALDLTSDDACQEAVNKIREDVLTLGLPPLVLAVVDTQAAATQGIDENSAQETGIVTARLLAIKEGLQCALAVVHHHGKDAEKGLRGSSAMSAAADSIVTFELDDTVTPAVQTATVTKARGMRRMRDPIMSQVRVVDFDVKNNFDEPITAMILVPAETKTLEDKREGEWEKIAAKGLRQGQAAICDLLDTMQGAFPEGVPEDELVMAWFGLGNGPLSKARLQVTSAIQTATKSTRLAWVDVTRRTLRSGRPGQVNRDGPRY